MVCRYDFVAEISDASEAAASALLENVDLIRIERRKDSKPFVYASVTANRIDIDAIIKTIEDRMLAEQVYAVGHFETTDQPDLFVAMKGRVIPLMAGAQTYTTNDGTGTHSPLRMMDALVASSATQEMAEALLVCSRRRAEITHEALIESTRIQTADNEGPGA